MKEFEMMDKALELAHQGYKIFPLIPGDKRPIKGQSYHTATDDEKTIFDQYINDKPYNIGLRLDTSNLLVVDIDVHSQDKNGRQSLYKWQDQGKHLPEDTYIEKTPNGGLHYFFKYSGPRVRISNIMPGIDVLSDFCVIAPSQTPNGCYAPLNDNKGLADVVEAPRWLIELIQPKTQNVFVPNAEQMGQSKKWFGRLLDEMVQGADQGNRNAWLTRIAGKLFWTGADSDTVYFFLMAIDREFLDQPLSENEVRNVYKSILKKESEASA